MADMEDPIWKPQPERRGCAVLFVALMLLLGSAWGASLGLFVWVLEDAKTTITALEDYRPKIGSKIFSTDGEMLGEFSIEKRQLVPLHEMPLHLPKAFIATEDNTFYEHKGVRIDAIINSFRYGIQTGRMRGGSTITQQVVRNVEPLAVGLERSIRRKIREAIVAFQVEREFTKDEILELYLNQLFLGISAHGVEAAAQQYFMKSCRDLTLGESATLAGIARLPNRQEPIHHFDNALARRNIVLGQMFDSGFISRKEYEAALAEDLASQVITAEQRAERHRRGETSWLVNRFKAPYFSEEIRLFMRNMFDTDEVFGDGLEIHTTIDMRLQRHAEEALLNALKKFDEDKLEYLRARNREDEFVPVSGALVCLDNRAPYRGYVRALVGGRDFDTEKYNMATQARRQPGSSVKPFVWAAAIASGMTPSTIVVDEPFVRLDGARRIWRPSNFDNTFSGPITLRRALEKSVNIVSIKLVEQVGMPVVRSYMQSCGITTPIDDAVGLTIALGTPEVTVLDHCVAYSTFANGGVRNEPIMVTEVRNRDGITRYDYRDYSWSEQAMDPRIAFIMTHLMEGVCIYGTGSRTAPLERARAGKTGTTNQNRNVWFCGYTPDFTTVVWIGYPDNRPLGSGINYTGGRLACPIWTEFMMNAHEGLPKRNFEAPYGIEFFNVDRESGVKGGKFREAFLTGTQPPDAWHYVDYSDLDDQEAQLLEEL
jgi:penicillin-binding protein 1A